MKRWLAKLLMIIAIIILIIIAIILAIPTGGASIGTAAWGISASGLTLAGTTIGVGALSAVTVGTIVLAYMIDAKTASETVGRVGKAVGDILSSAGNAAGRGISGIFSGLSWLAYALLGIGALLILKDDND